MKNIKNLTYCALFVALITAGAFIKVPVPVVPFTLQLLFTMLAGLLLGAKLGGITVSIYVLMGLIGFPVFTEGGGLGYIFNTSFGYLIGFAVGAYVTGLIANKKPAPSYKRLLVANFVGLAIVYAFGTVYLYLISNLYLGRAISAWTVLLYGFFLAVPGDIVLCFLAANLAKRLIPIMQRDFHLYKGLKG
ncbi:MAG: biotin transporter BioY [Catonella sp.]|uniref:biotin transporter BioY n=1 Tax=Catonella sp. TaxID=2382125 RepID=UPI003FA17986